MFGPKRDEMVGGWRNLLNEDFHNWYSSSDIIRMMKLLSMRWARHVARMELRNGYIILIEKLK
jgi:hypothetical protein